MKNEVNNMDFYNKPSPKDVLAHHGIKGQKWGVRRFQNADGSLTAAGKKRLSKEYHKESNNVMSELSKKYSDIYVKSYNKAADHMNGGGIDKFNAQQRKKYGDDFANREGYAEEYAKKFNKILNRNLNEALLEFYENNDSFKKAAALVEKYGMTEWDELAKNNTQVIEELRSALSGKK
jgi:hypothetical protein